MRRWFRDRLFLRQVLREVNALRRGAGLARLWRIPKGKPGTADHCALARAIQGTCGRRWAWVNDDGTTTSVDTPPRMAEFIPRFDAREFPHLIERTN